jgi:hypothetical protein
MHAYYVQISRKSVTKQAVEKKIMFFLVEICY